MIVTCKACQKRYLIEQEDIGVEGRRVRCVACGHSWQQKRLEETLNVLPLKTTTFDPGYTAERRVSRNFPWLMILSSLFILGISFYMARGTIVSKWPSAEKVFTAFKIPVHPPYKNLVLENVVSFQGESQDLTYGLKGELVNESTEVKPLPTLKIIARGNCHFAKPLSKIYNFLTNFQNKISGRPFVSLCELESWTYELTQTRIFPGERITFETPSRLTLPGTTTLSIEF